MSIDRNRLAQKIRASSVWQTDVSSRNYADRLCDELDERFEPLLQAWIEDEPLPDISVGKYDVNLIMSIKRNQNFIQALRLLNLYAKDPERGEKGIWTPAGRFRI